MSDINVHDIATKVAAALAAEDKELAAQVGMSK